MFIVPGLPPMQTRTSTRHSRELGKRVEGVVRDYRREYPDLTDDEVRAALTQSIGESESADAVFRRRKAAILASVIAAGMAGAFVSMAGSGGRVTQSLVWTVLGVAAAASVIAIVAIRRIRND